MEAILFIGIQAVGKSTFYREHFSGTHVHINLDTLKTRGRELQVLQSCLEAKQSFVIDNTNTLRSERARYIGPARAAGFQVRGYYFQSRLQEAMERNRQRSGLARIPDKGVLATHRRLEIPSLSEGFERLFYVSIDPISNNFLIGEWQDEV